MAKKKTSPRTPAPAPRKKRRGRYTDDSQAPAVADNLANKPDAHAGSGGADADSRSLGEILETKQFIDRIHRWWKQSSEASVKWRNAYIENCKFLSNDQWSDEDKSILDTEDGGRPRLVINKMLSPVLTISGVQRDAKQETALVGYEPGDNEGARVFGALVKWVRDKNRMPREDSKVFLDKIHSGLGFWRFWYDYRRKPQGEIRCTRVNPLNVFWDPNWPECEWADCEYVIFAQWYTLEQAIAAWPEYEEQIRSRFGEWLSPTGAQSVQGRGELAGDSQAIRRDFWDPQTQRVRILEVQYKETITVPVAVFKDGEVISDPDEMDQLRQVMEEMGEKEGDLVRIVRRPVESCRCAYLLDNILLEDKDSELPFDDYGFYPSLGLYFWQLPFGMADVMKDPQREKNKRRSAITEMASRGAHSGFYNKKTGGADRSDIENYAFGAGVVIEYETEMPKKIDPDEIPQVLIYLEKQADAEIHQSVNVNDELLGQTNQVTVSGRAINARQRGGLLTQNIFFDTFADEMTEVTRLLARMIKDKMTAAQAYRILGLLASDPRNQNDEALAPMREADSADVERLLSRAFSIDYDVVVTIKPFDATQSQAVFQNFLDFAKQVPVPPDMLVAAATKAGLISAADGQRLQQSLQDHEQGQPGGGVPLRDTGSQPGPAGEGPEGGAVAAPQPPGIGNQPPF